jgi:hypothetical protein
VLLLALLEARLEAVRACLDVGRCLLCAELCLARITTAKDGVAAKRSHGREEIRMCKKGGEARQKGMTVSESGERVLI